MGYDGFTGFIGFIDADAAALAEIDHDVAAADAALAAAQAQLTRALARGAQLAERQAAASPRRVRDHDMARRAIAAELAGTMRVADRTVQRRMDEAAELVEHYPATLDALEAHRIHTGHVRLIVESGAILPPEARPAFEAAALPRCEADTPGRVRSAIRMLAERMHPRTLTERHQGARETRRVFVRPVGDGMCELTAILPLVIGDGIYDRLTRQGRALQDERNAARERLRLARDAGEQPRAIDEVVATDERPMDHLRADLLADMLLTCQPDADPTRDDDGPGTLGALRARVQVVSSVPTLRGADEHPADLAGRGPIDAPTARKLAGVSDRGASRPGAGTSRSDDRAGHGGGAPHPWDPILTEPARGHPTETDRRDVPPAFRRFIQARDQRCRFPGCWMPAIRCEIDHTIDHALGGPTALGNLACLCQRHHSMKQFTPWRVRQLAGGVLEWTSPLGKAYTDRPPQPLVCFTPDDEPVGVDAAGAG